MFLHSHTPSIITGLQDYDPLSEVLEYILTVCTVYELHSRLLIDCAHYQNSTADFAVATIGDILELNEVRNLCLFQPYSLIDVY